MVTTRRSFFPRMEKDNEEMTRTCHCPARATSRRAVDILTYDLKGAPKDFYVVRQFHFRELDLAPAGDSSEPVGAPVLTAHTVVHEKQPISVVLRLHGAQSRVIAAPERLLP